MLKRSLWLALLAALTWTTPAAAQVTITYTFSNGTTADADQVNANFTALSTQSLNRTGGTITGNIAVNSGVTIDGVDISAALSSSATPTFASLTLTGGLTAGSGTVGIIDSSGKIPAISSTYFASLSGTNLTALNASNLSSGTVPLAQLSGITNTQIAAGAAIGWTKLDKTGSSLADIATRSASDLSSGTLASARLSGTYSGTLAFDGAVTFSGTPVFSVAPKVTSSTGAGVGTNFAANNPAIDPSGTYTWLIFKSSDGSTVYVPAWK